MRKSNYGNDYEADLPNLIINHIRKWSKGVRILGHLTQDAASTVLIIQVEVGEEVVQPGEFAAHVHIFEAAAAAAAPVGGGRGHVVKRGQLERWRSGGGVRGGGEGGAR